MSAESSRANQTDTCLGANLSEHDSNGAKLINQLWQSNQDKLASTFIQMQLGIINNDTHQQTLRHLLRQNSSGNHGNIDEQRRGNVQPNRTEVRQVHQVNTDQNEHSTDGNRTQKGLDKSALYQVKGSQMELGKNPHSLVDRIMHPQKLPEESPVHQVERSLGVQSETGPLYQPRAQVTHARQVGRTPVMGSGYNQPGIGHLHRVAPTPVMRTHHNQTAAQVHQDQRLNPGHQGTPTLVTGTHHNQPAVQAYGDQRLSPGHQGTLTPVTGTHHNQPAVQAYGDQRLSPGHQGTPTPVMGTHDNQPAVQAYGDQRLSPGHHVVPTPGVGPNHSASGVQVNKDQHQVLVQNHFEQSLSQMSSSFETNPSVGRGGALRLQESPPVPTASLKNNQNPTWEEQCRRQYEIISQGMSMPPTAVRSVPVSTVQQSVSPVQGCIPAVPILTMASEQRSILKAARNQPLMPNTKTFPAGLSSMTRSHQDGHAVNNNQPKTSQDQVERQVREDLLAFESYMKGESSLKLLMDNLGADGSNVLANAEAYKQRNENATTGKNLAELHVQSAYTKLQQARHDRDVGRIITKDPASDSGTNTLNMQPVPSGIRKLDDHRRLISEEPVQPCGRSTLNAMQQVASSVRNLNDAHDSSRPATVRHSQVANQSLTESGGDVHPNCQPENCAIVWVPPAHQLEHSSVVVCKKEPAAAKQVKVVTKGVAVTRTVAASAGLEESVLPNQVSEQDASNLVKVTMGSVVRTCIEASFGMLPANKSVAVHSKGEKGANTSALVEDHPPPRQQVRSFTKLQQSRTETSQSKRHSDSPKAYISYTCPLCAQTFPAYPILQEHIKQWHLTGQGTNSDDTTGTSSLERSSADHTSGDIGTLPKVNSTTQAAPCGYTQATDDTAVLGTSHEGYLMKASQDTAFEGTSTDGSSDDTPGGIPPAEESSSTNDISSNADKKMTCLKCGRFFSDVEELSNHVQTVHHKRKSAVTPGLSEESGDGGTSTLESDPLDIFRDFNIRESDPAPMQVKFTCGVCGKQFVKQGNLDLHMKTACAIRLPSCPTCSKSFCDMEELRVHRILCRLTDGAKETKSASSERGVPGRTLWNGAKRQEKKKIIVKRSSVLARKGKPKYDSCKNSLSEGKVPVTCTKETDQKESLSQANYLFRKSTFVERKRLAKSRVDMQREDSQRRGRSASSGYALRQRALKILAKSKKNAIAKKQNASGTCGKPVRSGTMLRNLDNRRKEIAVPKTLNSSKTSGKSKPPTVVPGRKPKTTNGQKTSKSCGKQDKSINLLEEDLSCSLCGRVFTRCDTIIKHQKVCRRTCSRLPGQRLLRCLKCRRLFMGKDALRQHKLEAHVCGVCGQTFQRPGALLFHRKNHIRDGEMEMNRIAGGGGKQKRPQQKATKASSSKTLPASSKTVSSNAKAAKSHGSSSAAERRTFVCKTCGKTYISSQFLWIHEKMHELAKSDIPMVDNRYVCETCGQTFKSSSNLLMHSRIHVSLEIFTCSGCGSGFQSSGACLKHARTCDFSYQTNNNSQKSSENLNKNMNNSDVNLTPVVSLQEVDSSFRDPSQQPTSFANGRFVCTGCGDYFPSAHLCLLHGKVCDQLYYQLEENKAQDIGSGKVAARDEASTSKKPITKIKQERGTVDDLLDALVGETGTIEVNLWSRSSSNSGQKVCEKLRLQRDGVDNVVEKLHADDESRNSMSGAEPQSIVSVKKEKDTDHLKDTVSVKKEKDTDHLKDTVHSFKCKYCGRWYTKLSRLHFHQVQTGCKRLHSCSCCGEAFTDVIQHIEHELTHESLSKPVQKLMEERLEELYCPVPKSYMCGKCGKLFSKYVKCLRHRVIYHAAGRKNKMAATSSHRPVAIRTSSNLLQCSDSTLPMQSPDDTDLFGGTPSQESNYSSDEDIFDTGLNSVGLSDDDEQVGVKDSDDTGCYYQETPNEKSRQSHEQDSRDNDMDMGLDSVGSSEDRRVGDQDSDSDDDEKSTKFQCTACERSFGRKCELGRHEQVCEAKLRANKERTESENGSFNRPTKLCCKPCGISFRRVIELKMHEESCNKTTAAVQKTQEVEATGNGSDKEMEPNAGDKTDQGNESVNDKESVGLQCETCKRTCKTFYALREHERACRTKVTDKLEQSDKSGNVEDEGNRNEQGVKGVDGKPSVSMQCKTCMGHFKSLRGLHIHEYTCKTKPTDKTHQNAKSQEEEVEENSQQNTDGKKSGRLKCETCKLTCKTTSALREHERMCRTGRANKRKRNAQSPMEDDGNRTKRARRSVTMQCKMCKQHFKSLRGLHIHENTCKVRTTDSTKQRTKSREEKSAKSVANRLVSKRNTNVQRARNVQGSNTKVHPKTRPMRKVTVREESSTTPKQNKAASTTKNKDKETSDGGESSTTPKKNKAASSKTNQNKDTADDAEWYKCDVCNGSFIEKAGFDFHVKICIPSYQCMVCGVTFRKEATWIDHMGTHDDVTYWCCKCKKSHEVFSEFRKHEKACVEICIHCGKKMKSKEECLKHEETCKKRPK